MTRSAKLVVLISAFGFTAGVVAGIHEGRTAADGTESGQALSDFAARQLLHADPVHARDAAPLEIRLLEQLKRLDPNAVPAERVLAYARLGVAEQATRDVDTQRAAFDQARAQLKNAQRP